MSIETTTTFICDLCGVMYHGEIQPESWVGIVHDPPSSSKHLCDVCTDDVVIALKKKGIEVL